MNDGLVNCLFCQIILAEMNLEDLSMARALHVRRGRKKLKLAICQIAQCAVVNVNDMI